MIIVANIYRLFTWISDASVFWAIERKKWSKSEDGEGGEAEAEEAPGDVEAGGEAHGEDMADRPLWKGRKLFVLAGRAADSTTGQAGFTGWQEGE